MIVNDLSSSSRCDSDDTNGAEESRFSSDEPIPLHCFINMLSRRRTLSENLPTPIDGAANIRVQMKKHSTLPQVGSPQGRRASENMLDDTRDVHLASGEISDEENERFSPPLNNLTRYDGDMDSETQRQLGTSFSDLLGSSGTSDWPLCNDFNLSVLPEHLDRVNWSPQLEDDDDVEVPDLDSKRSASPTVDRTFLESEPNDDVSLSNDVRRVRSNALPPHSRASAVRYRRIIPSELQPNSRKRLQLEQRKRMRSLKIALGSSPEDNSAGYWTNAGHNFHQESHGLSYNTTLPLASPKPLAGLPIETNEKNYRNKRWLSYVTQNVVRDLSQHGFCVLDGFLDLNVAKRINDEVTSMHGSQMFSAGRVVSPHVADIDRNKIRGDQVAWVTGQEPYCKYVGELITNVDLIIKEATKSQESSRLSNYDVQYRTKAMVACYPGAGTKYEKHVDNADSDGRCITAIYYTNKGWTEKDGGVLRVYPSDCKNAMANIDPLFNRMLFFYSDKTNPHEVLPANSIRHAITVWYFDHKERVEYLALRKQRRRLQQQQEQQQQQQQHLVHMHPAAPFKMQQHQQGGRPSVS